MDLKIGDHVVVCEDDGDTFGKNPIETSLLIGYPELIFGTIERIDKDFPFEGSVMIDVRGSDGASYAVSAGDVYTEKEFTDVVKSIIGKHEQEVSKIQNDIGKLQASLSSIEKQFSQQKGRVAERAKAWEPPKQAGYNKAKTHNNLER